MNSKKFFQDDGDNTVRINYNLDSNSTILDLGFHEGSFAKKLYDKYNCNIIGYEPMIRPYNIACNKFIGNNKIKINNYGLGTENSHLFLQDLDVATTIYNQNENGYKVFIKDIVEEFNESNFSFIDLMKINIEGAEYSLLMKMLENNLHKKVKNFQIQFHQEFEREITRNDIWKELEKTHIITYNYDYVWENWELKQ